MLPSDVDIVLITEPGHELEGKNRLARIGFDWVIGYLDEPYQVMFTHRDDVQVASRLTAKAFDERAAEMTDLQIVDVRNPDEAAGGAIPNAITIPVGQLPNRLDELDAHQADRRVLRRRLPVLGRSEPAPAETASPTSATSWAATAPETKPPRAPERSKEETP